MPDSYYSKKEVRKRIIEKFQPPKPVSPLKEAIKRRKLPKLPRI